MWCCVTKPTVWALCHAKMQIRPSSQSLLCSQCLANLLSIVTLKSNEPGPGPIRTKILPSKPRQEVTCYNLVTAKLISAFVFATRIVQSLYLPNPKFQAASHLLLLYSLVCVGPGRKPRRQVYSQRGSFNRSQSGCTVNTECTALSQKAVWPLSYINRT